MASVLSAACIEIAFLVFTISTSLPLLNMGVMTMKMMSMTSITSTIGVTLISAMVAGACIFFIMSLFSLNSTGAWSPQPWAGAGEPCGLPDQINSQDPNRQAPI